MNNLDSVEPFVRRKVRHFIYDFYHGYSMGSGISCKACHHTADAARD